MRYASVAENLLHESHRACLIGAWVLLLTCPSAVSAALCTVDPAGGADYTTIQAAIDDAGCDPIQIAPALYVENLSITTAKTLTGMGTDASDTVIDGSAADSVMTVDVAGGGTVFISNLTVQNGSAFHGGGIYAASALEASDIIVQGNLASFYGGGIYVLSGGLTLTEGLVSDNEALSEGGGLYLQSDSSITDSQVLDNRSLGGGGGGGGILNAGNTVVSNSTISGNTSYWSGGGVKNDSGADTLVLTDVVVELNEADYQGGGIDNLSGNVQIENSQVLNNAAPGSYGGGIFNADGMEINGGNISGNLAGFGAGIYSVSGALALTEAEVSANEAVESGGGIYVQGGSISLDGSLVADNTTDMTGTGGGLYLFLSVQPAVVTDSIIRDNVTAGSGAGGIESLSSIQISGSTISGNSGYVGGISVNYSTRSPLLTLTNSTVSGNDGYYGGIEVSQLTMNNSTVASNDGYGVYVFSSGTARNSIIANNTSVNCGMSTPGSFDSGGHNIESGTDCEFTEPSDQQNTDPLLSALADNGGPTPTHAIGASSPAADAANPGGCAADTNYDGVTDTALDVDQRGVARSDLPGVGNEPPNAVCDIGAYEFESDLFTIGGTVSGLAGSGLVLQNSGGDDEPVNADGAFTFNTAVTDGTGYSATVLTQPTNPNQECIVTNASGTVGGANVSDIAVNCTTESYRIGGRVRGLSGSGLVLLNNGTDDKAIGSNGLFAFDTLLPDNSDFLVTVLTQPSSPNQTCSVYNGSGTLSGGNYGKVKVYCSTDSYTVGGTVSGLLGTDLTLKINGGDDEIIVSDGAFTFDTPLADGTLFKVTVGAQPTAPSQTCSITNALGQLSGANITDVAITCVTDTFFVGGEVSGLSGSGLVLQNNGGDDEAVAADGFFAFDTRLDDRSFYSITVKTQPTNPAQTCIVTNASGYVDGANAGNAKVTCATEEFTIGGSVSGLNGPGLSLNLEYNQGDEQLQIASDGAFVFASPVTDLSQYEVTILTQPDDASLTCSVSNGSGMLSGANVTDVNVTCATETYTVGGTVAGLLGAGLVLQINGGDDEPVMEDGAFTFDTELADGSEYAVSIKTQPTSPSQVCSVGNASGALSGDNVTNVSVTCLTVSDVIFKNGFEIEN